MSARKDTKASEVLVFKIDVLLRVRPPQSVPRKPCMPLQNVRIAVVERVLGEREVHVLEAMCVIVVREPGLPSANRPEAWAKAQVGMTGDAAVRHKVAIIDGRPIELRDDVNVRCPWLVLLHPDRLPESEHGRMSSHMPMFGRSIDGMRKVVRPEVGSWCHRLHVDARGVANGVRHLERRKPYSRPVPLRAKMSVYTTVCAPHSVVAKQQCPRSAFYLGYPA